MVGAECQCLEMQTKSNALVLSRPFQGCEVLTMALPWGQKLRPHPCYNWPQPHRCYGLGLELCGLMPSLFIRKTVVDVYIWTLRSQDVRQDSVLTKWTHHASKLCKTVKVLALTNVPQVWRVTSETEDEMYNNYSKLLHGCYVLLDLSFSLVWLGLGLTGAISYIPQNSREINSQKQWLNYRTITDDQTYWGIGDPKWLGEYVAVRGVPTARGNWGSNKECSSLHQCSSHSICLQLEISVDKCCVMNIGAENCTPYLTLNNSVLPIVPNIRDLGVIVSNDLSATTYVTDVVSKAHRRAKLILRTFISQDVNLLVRALYTRYSSTTL